MKMKFHIFQIHKTAKSSLENILFLIIPILVFFAVLALFAKYI